MALQQSWPKGAAAAEWRAHWPLVVASALGFTMIGVANFSLGPFMASLEKAFGWSRSEITSGFTIYAVTCVICQPIVGRMIDRFGPRRIALTGIALTGCAISLFAAANGSLSGWLLLWFFYSLTAQLILTPVWTSAVASEFEAGRGLALAATLSGSALSATVVPITSTLVIDTFGWRAAYPILGGGLAAMLLVVTWFLFYSRRDRLRQREGTAVPPVETGLSARQALRSPTFWKMAIAIFISFSLVMAFSIHLTPILTSTGLTRDRAALIAGSYGLFGVVGKFSYGVLANRFPGQVIAAAMMALPLATCALLLMPHPSVVICLIAISLVGASSGAQLQLLVYLTTRHFGMLAFGTIFGFISSALTIASGVGPVLASRLYDMSGDYHLLLEAGIPMSVLASLVMLWVGDYPEVRAAPLPAEFVAARAGAPPAG
jgi:MFS family permease